MTTGRSSAVATPGASVHSADGKRLGIVKEARADRFLIDVRWAPDYWLGNETIDNATDEMIQLIITKEAVGSAKLRNQVEGPGLSNSAEDFNGPAPQNRPPPTL